MRRAQLKLLAIVATVVLTGLASEAGAQWRTVPYDSSNFVGWSSMTWTVDEADQVTYSDMINDRTMTVAITLYNTSIGGTASSFLKVKIPGGHLSGSQIQGIGYLKRSGASAAEVVYVHVDPDEAYDDFIYIGRLNPHLDNHVASTNGTDVFFTMTFDLK